MQSGDRGFPETSKPREHGSAQSSGSGYSCRSVRVLWGIVVGRKALVCGGIGHNTENRLVAILWWVEGGNKMRKAKWRVMLLCLAVSFAQNAWSMCISDGPCSVGHNLQERLERVIAARYADNRGALGLVSEVFNVDVDRTAIVLSWGSVDDITVRVHLLPREQDMFISIATASLLEKEGLVLIGEDLFDTNAVYWDHLKTPKDYVRAVSSVKIDPKMVAQASLAALRNSVRISRAMLDQKKASQAINNSPTQIGD